MAFPQDYDSFIEGKHRGIKCTITGRESAGRRLISQPDMESQYPIIAAGAINVMLSTER